MSYNQEEKRDRKTLLWTALAILTLLNVITLYFFFQERQENSGKDSVIVTKTQEVLNAQRKLDSISVQMDAKILQIQQLGGRVDSLVALKEALEKDKADLANNISGFSTKKYEDKIRSYEKMLAEKDEDISKLKRELGTVTAQNQELNAQVNGLQSHNTALIDSVDSYSTLNRELSKKVTIASALKAEKIQTNAVSDKGKERDGGKYKARRIDRLKISFHLMENSIAQQETKDVFLRVLDPDGAVLSDMATGSGSFRYNGRETIYSSKQSFMFTNTNQEVVMYYGKGGIPLKSGKHIVELYCEGFKIGVGDFVVK